MKNAGRKSDFGKGFYATTSLSQAKDWAKKNMSKFDVDLGYVNIYEINATPDNGINIKTFKDIDEWIDFVEANRTIKGYKHNYDIVYGKVADDDIYQSFVLYESGVISRKQLKENLLTKQDKLIDQFSFHTDKALSTLKFIKILDFRLESGGALNRPNKKRVDHYFLSTLSVCLPQYIILPVSRCRCRCDNSHQRVL